MCSLEIKTKENSSKSNIKRQDFFEKQVEKCVNQKISFNLDNNSIHEHYFAQLFKITEEDLIDPEDGTQLAAFVQADEPLFNGLSSRNSWTNNNPVCVSWSWPPPLKRESEGLDELFSSFELI